MGDTVSLFTSGLTAGQFAANIAADQTTLAVFQATVAGLKDEEAQSLASGLDGADRETAARLIAAFPNAAQRAIARLSIFADFDQPSVDILLPHVMDALNREGRETPHVQPQIGLPGFGQDNLPRGAAVFAISQTYGTAAPSPTLSLSSSPLSSAEALQKLCEMRPVKPIRISSMDNDPVMGAANVVVPALFFGLELYSKIDFFRFPWAVLNGVAALLGLSGITEFADHFLFFPRQKTNGAFSRTGGFTDRPSRFDRWKGKRVTPMNIFPALGSTPDGLLFVNGARLIGRRISSSHRSAMRIPLLDMAEIVDITAYQVVVEARLQGRNCRATLNTLNRQAAESLLARPLGAPLWIVLSRDTNGEWNIEDFGDAFLAMAASGDMDGRGDDGQEGREDEDDASAG